MRAAIEQLGAFDLRAELQAFVRDPRLLRRQAEERTIAQLAQALKVAMQDQDRAACERLQVWLALWAPRHPLLAHSLAGGAEATVVDRSPADGPRTLATGVHHRGMGLLRMWRHLPVWLRALAVSVVSASLLGGAGLGLRAQRAAEVPEPLQLAVIRPMAPSRARPSPTPVAVDLNVVGPRGALHLDGDALGRVRARRLWLAPGHHHLQVGARGRGWSRDFDLPVGTHAQLRIDVARHQISLYAG